MSNRPSIPAEIAREILIECGHRCAVCGTGCPLERAHIIPWHESREHKIEDLICLCANCHERADREKWGEATLREYKRRPWVLRQYENERSIPEPKTKVELTIEMELDHFDEKNQRWLQHAIAGFLEISPNAVRITLIERSKSVKVTIELPKQSAEKLLSAYQKNDPELIKYLDPLVLTDLRLEADTGEQVPPKFTADMPKIYSPNNKVKEMIRQKIETQTARAGVIGLGYVGLPLMVTIAKAGFPVTGIDISRRKVECIQGGTSDIADIPSETLAPFVQRGQIQATTDYQVLSELDTVNICVPTPLRKSKDPDMSFIIAAVDAIAQYIHKGQLIILESTTYPGTTEEIVLPTLQKSGLRVGKDFFLAFSPERIDPGNQTYSTANTPKIVGGITPACTEIAQLFYEQFINKVHTVSSTRAAEMVKLLENTFRSVNIGLVNEMALMCDRMGLDVWEIVDAAATKPFGFMPFYPGPGLGGHCIPIDPHYLSWKAKTFEFYARFIELASEINGSMPEYVLGKITDALNRQRKAINGSQILIMGVAYKKDVGDTRESPAIDVIRMLVQRGGKVLYHDPYVPELQIDGLGPYVCQELTAERVKNVDCVAIMTNHTNMDYNWIVNHAVVVVDARNATKFVETHRNKIIKI